MSNSYRYVGPLPSGRLPALGGTRLLIPVAHAFVSTRLFSPDDGEEWEIAHAWVAERQPPQKNQLCALHKWDGVGWWMNDFYFLTQDDQLAFEFKLRWC